MLTPGKYALVVLFLRDVARVHDQLCPWYWDEPGDCECHANRAKQLLDEIGED